MQTEVRSAATATASDPTVSLAAHLLSAGEIVALPTETVYGLGADALNPQAVAKVFEAKERPFFDPLICHLPHLGWLERVAHIPDAIRAGVIALTERFWPGPLTLVLPRTALVPDLVTAGLETVALRMSAHPVFVAIARTLDRPIAAPSANRFGRISPTAAAHVLAELEGRIPLIVDGGATTHGLESTIVQVEPDLLHVLRSGPITVEELAEFGEVRLQVKSSTTPQAPGQLESHYAPRTPLRLLDPQNPTPTVSPAESGYLAWRDAPAGRFAAVEILSPQGDLREAAATLFAKLRELDERRLSAIIAEVLPEEGLGMAIMDRLRRASAATPPKH